MTDRLSKANIAGKIFSETDSYIVDVFCSQIVPVIAQVSIVLRLD